MTRPTVSIVLLNFNHGRFLPAAIKALIAALGQDDEVLAFDDASTDDSLEIYKRFAKRCPQLTIIAKAQNQGIIACMNEGLSRASRDLIYFAASDDRIDPPFVDTMAGLLGAHPEAGLAGCRTRLIDSEDRDLGILRTPLVLDRPGFLTREQVTQAFMEDDNWLVGISTVYRRTHLAAEGKFREALESFSDGFASRLVAMRHGACFAPDVLTNWRRQAEGYASSQSADMAAVRRIAATARRLMDDTYPDVFPPRYGGRWQGRWLFGARYYGWCRRQEARFHTGETGGSGRRLGAVTRVLYGMVIFLRYRYRDIWAVSRRRLGYWLRGRSGTYARTT